MTNRHKYRDRPHRTAMNWVVALCLLAVVSVVIPKLLLPLVGDQPTDVTITAAGGLVMLVLMSLIW